jgi:anhydro-N-acetylmuramic acid kinase
LIYYKTIILSNISPKDVIRTLTETDCCYYIKNSINGFNVNSAEVIVSGGGTRNNFLMELLKSSINNNYKIKTSDETGIPSDAKEAVCFAYLGYLHLNNFPGNIPSVTGAKGKTVLGSVSLP